MAANERTPKQKGFEINIIDYLIELSKNWWRILIVAIVIGFLGGVVGKMTTKKTYLSTVSFIVSTMKEGQIVENSAISAQMNMTNTFTYILSNSTMMKAVSEACPGSLSPGFIRGSISVNVVASTFVIELHVRTEDPDTSYNIAKTVVDVYDDVVTKAYPNAMLNVCETPQKAVQPEANSLPTAVAAVGAVLGVAVYCIIVLIIFIMRDTVKSADELSEKLNLPVLGSVQNVTNKNKTAKGLLIVDRKTGFSFIETYKAIRTKIENNSVRTGNKVYLVASACENEGKTTVSVNIALSLAQNGKSVLIIDADLRNPSVIKTLALPESGSGFSHVIKEEVPIDAAIKYVKSFNLYVLADSYPVPNPSELLSTRITEQVINSVKEQFDFVIIDTTPASLVTDTSVMAGFVDAAIMVVRSDSAPLSRIRMSVEDIDSNGAEIVGCVFNADNNGSIKRTRYGRYGYGRYGYGRYGGYGKYGYNYGYGSYKNQNGTEKD